MMEVLLTSLGPGWMLPRLSHHENPRIPVDTVLYDRQEVAGHRHWHQQVCALWLALLQDGVHDSRIHEDLHAVSYHVCHLLQARRVEVTG